MAFAPSSTSGIKSGLTNAANPLTALSNPFGQLGAAGMGALGINAPGISDPLGISSMMNPAHGSGFQAQAANITNPVTEAQVGNAYETTQDAIRKQAEFVAAVNAANGVGNQSQVYGQLQDIAAGKGPNPAQAALAQATGTNVANQAALMAGQRGAGANAGMIARQAAMQGANIQQQAAGQGATLQAQQSLGAIGQAGGLATQQANQQANAIMGLNQATQSEQQNLLNAQNQVNQANVAMQNNINNANAGIASTNAQNQAGLMGGLIGGAGSAITAFAAHGGMIKKNYADGGPVGPSSNIGKMLFSSSPTNESMAPIQMDQALNMPKPAAKNPFDSISKLAPAAMMLLNKGGPINGEKLAAKGMKVPGQAKVKGDSLKNDTVDAKLSPGEIVIPRSVVNSKNAPEAAARFVAAVLAKQRLK